MIRGPILALSGPSIRSNDAAAAARFADIRKPVTIVLFLTASSFCVRSHTMMLTLLILPPATEMGNVVRALDACRFHKEPVRL